MNRRMLAGLLVAWAVLQGEAVRAAEPEQTMATYGE